MTNRWILAFASVLCGACTHDHGPGGHQHDEGENHDHGHAEAEPEGHGHEHAEDAIGITAWSETFELFAEHPPAIAGEPVQVLAHLTVLSDFSALSDGEVRLVLDGPAHVEATANAPLRPGIFQPAFVAPEPGTYRGRLHVRGGTAEGEIEGFTIEVHADRAHAQASGDASPDEPATISFLKEQQWKIPFATAFARSGGLVPTVQVTGEVTTPPGGRAEVGAPVAGRIVASKEGLPRPGQRTKRGAVLASIAPAPASPEDAARTSLAIIEADARVQAAEAAVARAKRLLADRAIPTRELEDAERELRVAQQAARSARDVANMFKGSSSGRGAGTYRLTAPIDGIVTTVRASAGQSVVAGNVLFEIIDPRELWIVAKVPERDAARLRSDADASYRVNGETTWRELALGGDRPTGSVVHVARVVDPVRRTVDLVYALNDPEDALRVGASVDVHVPIGEPWTGVIVPATALFELDGRQVVYVQREGEAFEERVVRVAVRRGDAVGLGSGVEAGERIVTEGAGVIRLSAAAGAAPSHGHVH